MPPKGPPNEPIRFKSEVLDAVNGWLGDYNVPTRALTAARPGVRLGIGAVPSKTEATADTGFLKRLLRKRRRRQDEEEEGDLDESDHDEDSRFSQLTKRGESSSPAASSPPKKSSIAPQKKVRVSTKETKSRSESTPGIHSRHKGVHLLR